MYRLPQIIDEKDNSVVLFIVAYVYVHDGQFFFEFECHDAEYGDAVWFLVFWYDALVSEMALKKKVFFFSARYTIYTIVFKEEMHSFSYTWNAL